MPLSNMIMGGVFGWEFPVNQHDHSRSVLELGRQLRLANGRSAINILVDQLRPSTIWLPSYLCDSILLGIENFNGRILFYPVDINLKIHNLDWLDHVSAGDLVLVVDYFGWRPESKTFSYIRSTGALVLEDASQALLTSDVGSGVDYLLFSPRKFLPVPDGGILCAVEADFLPNVLLHESPDIWWYQAFQAIMLRGEFDRHGGDRAWFDLFQSSEMLSPVGPYAMSEFSERALRFLFDYNSIASARIRNYHFLFDYLGQIAVYPQLPAGTVPLGFPVRLSERDRLRQKLFSHNIYPAVHWTIPSSVPEYFRDSRKLADEIMTLPCDQRYGLDDMKRMVDLILEIIKE